MRRLFCSLLFFVAACANAGGSVDFREDVWPLMQQKPFFARSLEELFIFDKDAWGIRIGQEVYPNLGGARMGPYEVKIRYRSDESKKAVMIIHTDTTFLDKKGRPMQNLSKAVDIRETFESIELREDK